MTARRGLILLIGAVVATACARVPVPTHVDGNLAGRLRGATSLLRESVSSGAFPGAVLTVGYRGRVIYTAAVGRYGVDDRRPIDSLTVYDLASLTKVVGLTTATMILVAEGRLGLDDPVAWYVPGFDRDDKMGITIRQLLTHTSGLPAWRPLHLETTTREQALDTIFATPLEGVPGTVYRYSDLGAISLGLVAETVSGESLDDFLDRRVFGPLGMTHTRYRPPAEWSDHIAPTEQDPWRGRTVRGEVHDENAVRLGGVSGHAGLFSTAPDLAAFCLWLLDAYHGRLEPSASPYLPAEVVRRFVTRQPGPEGSTRALGWDTPSEEGSSAGSLLSKSSFGHTGFTGTSVWIDPERELFVILLTNRVHPTRENNAIGAVRSAVADSVVAGIER